MIDWLLSLFNQQAQDEVAPAYITEETRQRLENFERDYRAPAREAALVLRVPPEFNLNELYNTQDELARALGRSPTTAEIVACYEPPTYPT